MDTSHLSPGGGARKASWLCPLCPNASVTNMSIYDDVASGSDDTIFAQSDDIVVPDWDVKKAAASGGGDGDSGESTTDTMASGGISVDETMVVCGKKTTKSTFTKMAGATYVHPPFSTPRRPAVRATLVNCAELARRALAVLVGVVAYNMGNDKQPPSTPPPTSRPTPTPPSSQTTCPEKSTPNGRWTYKSSTGGLITQYRAGTVATMTCYDGFTLSSSAAQFTTQCRAGQWQSTSQQLEPSCGAYMRVYAPRLRSSRLTGHNVCVACSRSYETRVPRSSERAKHKRCHGHLQ